MVTRGFAGAAIAWTAAVTRDRAFLAPSAALLVASGAATVAWCGSMSGGMPMPGGWTMSMAWMKMSEQTWGGAALSFTAMWSLMMVAMMLPALVPMLSSHRRALRGAGTARLGAPTAIAAAGYFFVWAVLGAAVYPLGVALAAAEMRWQGLARSVPIATGVVLLAAGGVQLTAWKSRQLGWCRAPGCGGALTPDAWSAWRHGLRLGAHCGLCCGNLVMVLLVLGVMDLGVMAAVTTAITVERLAPASERVARSTGVIVMAAGALAVARSLAQLAPTA
jgi:predicted metal-binding membrane protein